MPGPSDFVYQRMEVQTQKVTHLLTSGSSFALDIHATVESWLATDGSGRVVTTYTSVSFASDQDRAVWEDNGKPAIPSTGDVVQEPYLKSGLAYYPIDKLPTDPTALRAALNDGSVIEPAPGDLNLLSTIGTLLSQEDVPSDLRHALFEVAASIPTVGVEHDVLDPIGRQAVAISFVDDAGATRLFFDPTDAKFLGRSETFVSEGGGPGVIDWSAYLERGVVSDLGERPAS
jgi:hypothetical protein